jgi:hypothetical protein
MRLIYFIAFMSMHFVVSAQEERIAAIPIPADSKSPYDFRGESKWDDPAYQALFHAKTYGDLHEALIDFVRKWSARQNELKDPAHVAAYFTAKQALIRTSYLMGELEPGDKLMEEFHPKALGLMPTAKQGKLVDAVEREKINRIADQIRRLYTDAAEGDPYPNGPPADVHELYLPLLKMIQSLGN